MDNDKSNLTLETRRHYLLRALMEGIRRCVTDMRSAGKLLLGLLLYVIGTELWVYFAPPFVHGIIRSAQLVLIPFVLLGLLIWVGIVPGSWRMNRDLTRVGVVNAAGEAPFLIKRRKTDDGQDEYIFESKGVTPKMWRERVEEVQSALNLTVGSVKQDRDYRTVVVRAVPPNMYFGSTIMWDRKYVNAEDDADFVLGKTATGEIVHWDVEAMPHALIGGSTKSGKTRLCALILTQAVLRGADVRIIDLKGLDYRALEAMDAHLVTDKQGAVQLLRDAVEEMQRRKDLLDSAKAKSFREFNESQKTPLRRQFILVDECSALTNSGVTKEAVAISKECLDLMSTLACMGRAVGIHLIISTQVPDVASVPTAIRSNLDLKLCGKADTILSTMILNNGSANELIPKDSQGRFAMANGSETIVFQAFYYND